MYQIITLKFNIFIKKIIMKRKFMFVAAIAAGMVMTSCGESEANVEDESVDLTETPMPEEEESSTPDKDAMNEAQDKVDDAMGDAQDMVDDAKKQAEDAIKKGMEDAKKAKEDAMKMLQDL